ncbi:hypothetical protein D3C77_503650 [compost metagenome]
MQFAAGADPVAALDGFTGQYPDQRRVMPGHVVGQHGNPQAGTRSLLLGDYAGAAKHYIRGAAEAVEEQQFLAEQQVVDIADPAVPGQVFAVMQRWRLGQVLGAGVQRQAVIGEFAGDQQVGIRSFQVDADFRLAVEDADEARHRNQFHLQPRIAFEQAAHARGEEHDADAFGDAQANLA